MRGFASTLLLASCSLASAVAVASLFAPALPTPGANAPAQDEVRHGDPPSGADMGAMLVRGLHETEGCLAVEIASFESGKRSIVAFFEDREAALRWYHHPIHVGTMRMMGDAPSEHAMAHVPEGIPVMVIATLTPSDKPELDGVPMPIRQISVELFTPLPGGAAVGGRLAPETFKIPRRFEMAGSTTEPPSDAGSD